MNNETKAPKKKPSSRNLNSKDIRESYEAYVLDNGQPPASFFRFAKELGVKEETLYQFYNSFEAIEKDIWRVLAADTIKAIESEEVYREYSAREKLLAFYYTLIESLKKQRSYILWQYKAPRRPEITPYYLQSFRAEFLNWVSAVIKEGLEKQEIVDRPVLGKRYKEAVWLQTTFILGFWIKDESPGFEKTDVAIEKAVNLAFDVMGKGAVDSLIDFGKFLFQARKGG